MLARIKNFFSPPPERLRAHEAYTHIVAAARAPELYRQMEVPDTLDGRFDLIVLHLFMFVQRLRMMSGMAVLERDVVEVFFDDMDRTLRELGVSDTGVGKRIKQMVGAFYGRMAAYEAAGSDDALLAAALARNIYLKSPAQCPQVNQLVAYVRRVQSTLLACDADELVRGGWSELP